jgi:hypothetical protein
LTPDQKPKQLSRRILRTASFPLVVIAALFFWFEEWLWEPMARFMRWLGSLPVLRLVERFMSGASPYLALCFFIIPILAIFPFKIGGLWLIAKHHVVSGLMMFVGAKIVGTAIMAWILACTKPALMRLAWFAWAWGKFVAAKHWVYERVSQQPGWLWAKQQVQKIKAYFHRPR